MDILKHTSVALGLLCSQAVIALVFAFGLRHDGSASGPGAVERHEAPRKKAPSSEVLYVQLEEDIVANPLGTRGLRAVVAQVHVALASSDVATTIDEHRLRSVMNDKVQAALSARTVEELSPLHWEDLRRDIRDRLNTVLGEGAVTGVMIVKLVIQ